MDVTKDKVSGVEMQVLDEPWNIYRLEDDSMLKFRFVIGAMYDVIHKNKEGVDQHSLNFDGKPLITISDAPLHNRSDPRRQTDPYTTEDPKTDVDFEILNEDWNKYEVVTKENAVLSVRIKVTVFRVSRYDNKYDKFGFPIYNVSWSQVLTISRLN